MANSSNPMMMLMSPSRLVSSLGASQAKEAAKINSSSHLLSVSTGAGEVGTLTGKRLEALPQAP